MNQLIPGKPVRISANVHRLLAPNPGTMTGPGTNTYLVGSDELAVIDPGPAMDVHLEAINDAAREIGGVISKILVTHTHRDHSPAASKLAAQLQVPCFGMTLPNDGFQDTSFKADVELTHDQVVSVNGVDIRAIHTPGHVNNHLCYLIEQDQLLMTGDHLMNGSTVVIIPPAGVMADYIKSLQILPQYPITVMAPGHGELIHEPLQLVEHTIAHRLKREAKVIEAMRQCGPASIDTLTPVVYDDTPEHLHQWARLSLHAHLIKLQSESRALCSDHLWQLKP